MVSEEPGGVFSILPRPTLEQRGNAVERFLGQSSVKAVLLPPSGAVLLTPEYLGRLPGNLGKLQVSILSILGGDWDSAFPTSSQGMLLRVVRKPQ